MQIVVLLIFCFVLVAFIIALLAGYMEFTKGVNVVLLALIIGIYNILGVTPKSKRLKHLFEYVNQREKEDLASKVKDSTTESKGDK